VGSTGKRWSRRWRAWPVLVQDGVLAAVLAALTFVPGMAGSGLGMVRLPARPVDAIVVALALGQCLPLAVRRRAPALCLALVGGCFVAFQLRGSAGVYSGMGLVVALYSAGACQQRARPLLAGAASATYALTVLVLHLRGSEQALAEDVTFYLLSAACWAAGSWMSLRRSEDQVHRDSERSAVATAERARIARELHDVVTHHVTAMVIQADAAAYLTDRPERLSVALGDIAGAGRQALVELRHQLGVLQPASSSADGNGAARSPALEPLDDIVERARASGQPVRLVQHGQPQDLPGAVALAVHRIVQECLTNALKHAPTCPTTVTVDCLDAGAGTGVAHVEVVTDDPSTGLSSGLPGSTTRDDSRGLATSGSGRGLTGLAERVDLLGGHLEAGPRRAGGFIVRARIPVPAS